MRENLLEDLEANLIGSLVDMGAAGYNNQLELWIDQQKAAALIPHIVPKNTVINMFWVYEMLFTNVTDQKKTTYLDAYEYLTIIVNTLHICGFKYVKSIYFDTKLMSTYFNPFQEQWKIHSQMWGFYIVIVDNHYLLNEN